MVIFLTSDWILKLIDLFVLFLALNFQFNNVSYYSISFAGNK